MHDLQVHTCLSGRQVGRRRVCHFAPVCGKTIYSCVLCTSIAFISSAVGKGTTAVAVAAAQVWGGSQHERERYRHATAHSRRLSALGDDWPRGQLTKKIIGKSRRRRWVLKLGSENQRAGGGGGGGENFQVCQEGGPQWAGSMHWPRREQRRNRKFSPGAPTTPAGGAHAMGVAPSTWVGTYACLNSACCSRSNLDTVWSMVTR